MKNTKIFKKYILAVMLLVTLIFLIKIKSEKDTLQEKLDFIFTNSITESTVGLAMDYSKMRTEDKVQFYNQTLINLKHALDVFNTTSYKKYDDLFMVLSKLYIYLLEIRNTSYDIAKPNYIYEFLSKILVYPDDNQTIKEFNEFLIDKLKVLRGIKQ